MIISMDIIRTETGCFILGYNVNSGKVSKGSVRHNGEVFARDWREILQIFARD